MTEDNLAGSLAVKVSDPARISPWFLIGQEGIILMGSFAFKISDPTKKMPFYPIRGENLSDNKHRQRS